MTVFLMILEDRHTDVQVEVYGTRRKAMARAKQIVAQYDYTPEPDDEVPLPAEWEFNALLSCEGDAVRVEKAEVQ